VSVGTPVTAPGDGGDPRPALIIGRPSPLVAAIGAELSAGPSTVALAAPRFDNAAEVAACLAAAVGTDLPAVVVFADVDPVALQPRPLLAATEADWDRCCERPLRALVWCCACVHPWLAGREGRLIVVCPTVSMEGAAGLTPYASAVEGQRMLVKSAARRWGRDGVTVNAVAPAVADLAPGLAGPGGADARRSPPAVRVDDPFRAVARAVAWLARRDAAAVTGATVAVDGGAVMAP